ncbi:Uncharacterised protein [[Clostridium] sordellii]|uniref:zinc-ribbon domain-containing protein n=1 Tax=Paraclostridium sordellii TaxID=1505 RepID=UPI0005E18E0B|nr:zinc-ribbon domain-containing protein [Paeniclostridium sordellii]CEQ01737.1 Uncharacterised protein [[Clostridium] sordellii] [Paeniclostridium sordellii]
MDRKDIIEQRYKTEVEKDGEYEYIRSYRKHDVLPNGRVVGDSPYIQIKHKYCGSVYEVKTSNFINQNQRCGKCCGSYENSFAHHIEQELGESLEKYWDFEKNTVNPYYIKRNYTKTKVWIKCQEKDYHGSYKMLCPNFIKGVRCGFCDRRSGKVHPKDSFGYLHPDKAKCWHEDNDKSPYEVAPGSNKKYKFECEICNHVWSASVDKITSDRWCPQCKSSKGEKKIKEYLDKNDITYIHDEPYFDDLLSDLGNPLRPDFILPEHKIWIEYDGEFHFKDFYKDGSYEILKEHDKRKNEYAKKHGWKMIRIPYNKFDDIENILYKELKL